MLFNSINFAIFLPAVFFLYWFCTKGKLVYQNVILLISSYFFYACWDWRFLFLLIFSTLLDYFSGIKIQESTDPKQRKMWLWISIGINLGFLAIFKYYNFFSESFKDGLSLLGIEVNLYTLQLILPVGISFYTFHGLSYVIDIYKSRIKPELNFIDYSVFVSFFPLLVAGPIERATHLLPQIKRNRIFEYSSGVDGLRQILWGLFKKVVIADNCAEYANLIFNDSNHYSGLALFLGAIFFAIQIYGDFSGYSDIALGTARLFGIELLRNFAYPYFSRDIAEFWRRWHISLSSWFKDYLYIPLGGSKGGNWIKVRNTFIIFIVSGFWHGANWTFIMWGFLNALFILPSIILQTNRNHIDIIAGTKTFPSFRDLFNMTSTFFLTVIAWIFFRAVNITQGFTYISDMILGLPFRKGLVQTYDLIIYKVGFLVPFLVVIFFIIEWLSRNDKFGLSNFGLQWKRPYRWVFYYTLLFFIYFFAGSEQQFIYFQF
jgi:D-alanyl-lipoteichoic acid acyltransferase DltB (MBOAT superfamily)